MKESIINHFAAEKLQSMQMIICMLPDDGTDVKVIQLLYKEKGITVADSIGCRGISVLKDSKQAGMLSGNDFMKLVQIVVPQTQADMLFDYIYTIAHIGQPNSGWIAMSQSILSTPFSLPEDLEEEIN